MNDPLRGTARYTADIAAADALHVAFLRSDHAHAVLRGLDTAAALEVQGVVRVLTATDLGALGNFPAFLRQPTTDGRPLIVPRRPVLSEGRVRHVGELVAMVIGETAHAARDGVEALMPDYDELPPVVGLDGADNAPDIHPEAPGNLAARVDLGDGAATDAAMDAAHRVIELTVEMPRLSPTPMEPMAAIAGYNPETATFDLWAPHQGIAEQRRDICAVLGVAPASVRVHAERVGGAFGVRGAAFPETIALSAAARLTGWRLRWQGSRSEAFVADYHGRGMRLTGRLSLDPQHRFTAIDVQAQADLGAYVHPVGAHISVSNPLMTLTGCYRIPAARARFDLRFTNAVPMGPYRGAGRPDIALLVERLVDEAAAEIGIDRFDLRLLNALPTDAFPYATPVGATYDSGDYPGLISAARRLSDWDGFAARAEADSQKGVLRGIGAALFVEVAGGGATPRDGARLDVTWHDGATRIAVATATQSTGQDHEGLFRGLIGGQLGLEDSAIHLMQSCAVDTPEGGGSYASRSTIQAGSAVLGACTALIARLVAREAAQRGLSPDDLCADAQAIRDGDDRVICTLQSALDAAARAGAFSVSGSAPVVQTFPSGCHVAEVRIESDTGRITTARYLAVDDAGRVLSHHGLDGQIRGGVAQGISAALMEGHFHDRSGQLHTASFMDYALARATDIPDIQILMADCPSPTNPLQVKGVGEAGTTGALGAMANAVADALRRGGAGLPDMPLTPSKVWAALEAAKPSA